MKDYSLYRAVRFDHADGLLDKLKKFMSVAVMQCVLYDEEGQTTLKPHYQGWIKFENEEQMNAWEDRWKEFKKSVWPSRKGAGRGGNRPTYVKNFKNGEAAQVYCAKDGKQAYVQNVTAAELERLAAKSYQKGETRKQTFLNAIVQRMKEKDVKSRTEVYYELCEYYHENDKELNPWRLQPQCNTVCRMLWGKKFSQWLAETEVRAEFNAPKEDDAQPQAGEEDSEASSSAADSECSAEYAECEEVSGSGGDVGQFDIPVQQVYCNAGSASGVQRVHSTVHAVQDNGVQVAVHSGVYRDRRIRCVEQDTAEGSHSDRSDWSTVNQYGVRDVAVQQQEDDCKVNGAVQYLREVSSSGDVGGDSVIVVPCEYEVEAMDRYNES